MYLHSGGAPGRVCVSAHFGGHWPPRSRPRDLLRAPRARVVEGERLGKRKHSSNNKSPGGGSCVELDGEMKWEFFSLPPENRAFMAPVFLYLYGIKARSLYTLLVSQELDNWPLL